MKNPAKKIYVAFLVSVITAFFINGRITSAQSMTYCLPGDGKVYSYQELFGRFESFSIDYQMEVLRNQLQAAKALTADETYTGAQSDYLQVLSEIQKLKAVRDSLYTYRSELLAGSSEMNTAETLTESSDGESDKKDTDLNALLEEVDSQIAAVENQTTAYESNAAVLSKNSADAKLSKDLAAFYTNNQSLFLQESKNKSRHGFLQNCLNLMIYQEEIKYYALNQEYLTTQKEIEDIKSRYGLNESSQSDGITLSLLENDSFSAQKQSDYDALSVYIKRETGIGERDTLQYELPLSMKNYTLSTKTTMFKDNNTSYLQLTNMETSYQSYLYSGGITGIAYRRQIELTIEDYRLQKIQLGRQIEDYVKKALSSYTGAFRKMQAAKTELDIAEKKCKIIEESLKFKKATKLELKKAYADRQSVYLKYYGSCMEVILWEDILDNNIYLTGA